VTSQQCNFVLLKNWIRLKVAHSVHALKSLWSDQYVMSCSQSFWY